MFLVTFEKDSGILFANTLAQARQLKRFVRARGTLAEVSSGKGLEMVRVLGGYNDIAEANRLIAELRKG